MNTTNFVKQKKNSINIDKKIEDEEKVVIIIVI